MPYRCHYFLSNGFCHVWSGLSSLQIQMSWDVTIFWKRFKIFFCGISLSCVAINETRKWMRCCFAKLCPASVKWIYIISRNEMQNNENCSFSLHLWSIEKCPFIGGWSVEKCALISVEKFSLKMAVNGVPLYIAGHGHWGCVPLHWWSVEKCSLTLLLSGKMPTYLDGSVPLYWWWM